jgi:bile-acid 7alpha-dehydratase
MTDMKALENRIRVIEDNEAVKKLMARYWRCLDDKLWDELPSCFTPDVVADYGQPGWRREGRDALVAFLRENEGAPEVRISHGGMNPEVEIESESAASGIFKLHDWVVIGSQTRMRGFAQYRMRFTRRSGEWQIERLDLRYRYREDHAVYLDGKPAWTTPALEDQG